MINRYGRTWLTLFAIALYGGPVLAGFAGHGWSVLPVFAALFLLYVVATRKPDLATPAGWAGLVGIAVVQVALVAATWAIGLVGAQLAAPVVLPIWAPLAMTGVAAGLGAWAWRDAAEMNVMLDSAIRAIEEMDFSEAAPAVDGGPQVTADVRSAFERFEAALADVEAVSAPEIDPLVRQLASEAGPEAFALLVEDVGLPGDACNPAFDLAALRFMALPGVLDALIARGDAGLVPTILLDAREPAVRAEARARVADMLKAGAPADQMPSREWLRDLSNRFPGEGFETLGATYPEPAEA